MGTNEVRWVKLFRGLKFTYSGPGSKAAQHKGVGHWLWVDPQSKVGYYGHLVDQGYLLQERRGFSFALTPEIKTWREAVAESSRGSVGHALGQEEEVEDAEDDEDME